MRGAVGLAGLAGYTVAQRTREIGLRIVRGDYPPGTILPLGGLGEIGKNMTVVEYDGHIVVVDVGLRFPTAEMVGIDLADPGFWDAGLDLVERQLEQAEEAARATGRV